MGALRSFQSNMEVMITMKKLFKKSIACLIAVLMVVSTMPFTALSVQAAANYDEAPVFTDYAGITSATGTWKNSKSEVLTMPDNSYVNLLYCGSTGGDNASSKTEKTTAWLRHQPFVMLYDGETTAKAPVMVVYGISSKADRYIAYVALNDDVDDDLQLIGNWNASRDSSYGNNWDFPNAWAMNGSTDMSISTSLTATNTDANNCQIGKSGTFRGWTTTPGMANYLNFTGTFADGVYTKTIQIKITCAQGGSIGSAPDVFDYLNSNQNVYVVNYKAVLDKIEEAKTFIQSNDMKTYCIDKVNAYYSAVKDLQNYDVKAEFNGKDDTNFADGVTSCNTNISTLITNYNTAKNALTAHSYDMVKTPATCTEESTETYTCSCGDSYNTHEDPATGHDWGAWTSISDTQHKRVCENDNAHVETEDHNIVNGSCTKCDYVALDMAAYNTAVSEYEAIIGAGDYAAKYTEASRTDYQAAVEAAKKNSFASQEEVDAAAAAILSAKTKLVYAQPEIKFVEVDANGIENVIKTKSYPYGTPVEFTKDADNIAKWIVTTQNGKVETKVATSQTTYTMIATEPATVYVHLTEEKTEALEYSKVSFISKNGAVSSVQYVAKGTTIETIDVPGVKIPFYKFMNWDKASVTADGNDIEVKAVYEFIGTVDDKCNVHYDGFVGGEKEYTYDSFVYLFGAEDKTLALSTDGTVENIITYLNENAFYAPHTKDIYVIVVDSQQASIGITGSYASSTDTQTTYAFNCKLYVPADCTVVEYGLIGTAGGVSKKIRAEKASDRGEFTVKITASGLSSMSGKAYLTYKTADGDLVTIYSTTVTQA